jgi:hypothetical protein
MCHLTSFYIKVQWNRTILLVDRHKMDPWPLDEGWKPKSDKSRLNIHGTILEGKSIGSNQKNNKIKNVMIWKIKMQARVQGKVQLKDSTCFT